MNTSGPHGAGLSNMIFAPRDASIIEFPLRPQVIRCFGHMAMALGLDYWIVPQINAVYNGNYTMDPAKAEHVVRLVRHLMERKRVPAARSVHEEL